MRVNKYVAAGTGLSRRGADTAVDEGRVRINGQPAHAGQDVGPQDAVTLDGTPIQPPTTQQKTILLHKPVGVVVSRAGQGSKTVYDLLPAELHHLKPIGRLDKDSSGLLLLTTDGQLAQALTHPSRQKLKTYEVTLDAALSPQALSQLQNGVPLDDGLSRLEVHHTQGTTYQVRMHEGRNRQIRRTFAALGYAVTKLHRTAFGDYTLGELPPGQWVQA